MAIEYGSPLVPKQDNILQWMKCVSREKRGIFQVEDVYFNW